MQTNAASAINPALDSDSEWDEAMSADRRECAAVHKARGKSSRKDMHGQTLARVRCVGRSVDF